MRYTKAIILTLLIAGCVASATATASASPPVWSACLSLTEGRFENGVCTKENVSGSFEILDLSEATEISGSGSLTLEDSKAASGELQVKCSSAITGTVGSENEGKITGVELTSCTVVKGTCESPKASAIHLPWKTEATKTESHESEVIFRNNIKNSGSGAPGYIISCGSGTKTEDVCEFEAGTSTSLENQTTEGSVAAEFEASSGKATCNHGEKCPMRSATGTLKGQIKMLGPAMGGLRILPAGLFYTNPPGLVHFKGVLPNKFEIINATLAKKPKIIVLKMEPNEAQFELEDANKCNGSELPALPPRNCVVTVKLKKVENAIAWVKIEAEDGGGAIKTEGAMVLLNP
jgi:hypothetical protein